MSLRDITSERLLVEADLLPGVSVELPEAQAHYLTNVLRMRVEAELLIFNGRDGEWLAQLESVQKRRATLKAIRQVRPQEAGPDIDYLFAPLKRSRLDFLVQKATEMGVRRLRPVMTDRTIAERVNLERMRANVVEAAEQCGILSIPDVVPPVALARAVGDWDLTRKLVYCDETQSCADPLSTLSTLERGPVAVLVGPEGGFSEGERNLLLGKPFVVPISLGPRIMRADTAAVAALALINAAAGDWRKA